MAQLDRTPFVMPKLTLHIEAETMEELMHALDQVMGSLNPDHISAVRHDVDRPSVELDVHADKETADYAAAVDAASNVKRARGRPRKDAAPTATQEAEDDDIHHAAVTAAAQTPAQTPAQPAVDANAMQNLSPTDARKKGIDLITTYFAQNPTCLPQVQQISAKYGVGQFADVPDGQAHAFLADISLLVSGAGQV